MKGYLLIAIEQQGWLLSKQSGEKMDFAWVLPYWYMSNQNHFLLQCIKPPGNVLHTPHNIVAQWLPLIMNDFLDKYVLHYLNDKAIGVSECISAFFILGENDNCPVLYSLHWTVCPAAYKYLSIMYILLYWNYLL